jgi:hypothetical protein
MISHQQQKRLGFHEVAGARNGVPVAFRRGLLDETETAAVGGGSSGVRDLIPRANHHTNFFDTRRANFFDEDAEGSLGGPITVHQCLQRQGALGFPSGGNNSFLDLHRSPLLRFEPGKQLQKSARTSTGYRII